MNKSMDFHNDSVDRKASSDHTGRDNSIITPGFIDALRNGDPDAYYRLVERMSRHLTDFLTAILRSKEDAEEITQDIFIYIWQKREMLEYEKFKRLKGYLFTMARTKAIDRIKERRKDIAEYTDRHITSADHDNSPELIMEMMQTRDKIAGVIANMPPTRRAIYEMHYNQGLSNKDIAKKMGIEQSTVRAHISIALKEIKHIVGSLVIMFFC